MWGEAPEVRAGRSPLLTAASLALWCVLWEAIGRAGVSSIMPPLSRVVASGVAVVASGQVRGGGVALAPDVRAGHGAAPWPSGSRWGS